MCTPHTDTNTDRHSRKCLTVALPPIPAPFPSVAARSRRGRHTRAVAAAVRTSMPDCASFIYNKLGNAYQNLGSFSKALEYHTQDLTMAKEVGDRAREGVAYANLGNAYQSQGDFRKAIEYHTLYLAIAKEVGDRAGEGRAYGNLGIAYQSLGDVSKAIEYHAQDRGRAGRTGI